MIVVVIVVVISVLIVVIAIVVIFVIVFIGCSDYCWTPFVLVGVLMIVAALFTTKIDIVWLLS